MTQRNVLCSNFIVQLFCLVDDFCIVLKKENPLLGSIKGRKPSLTQGEVLTLGILFQLSQFKSLKSFYNLADAHYRSYFPKLPSYQNFVNQINSKSLLAAQFLMILLNTQKSKDVEIQFVDSTPLPVCKNKRINSHKVAKDLARRGVSSTGWFYGFKLHAVCDIHGNLLSIAITAGNVDDRKPLNELFKGLSGIAVGDAGYLSKDMQKAFLKQDIFLFTAGRNTMKKLMTPAQHALLKSRQRIEISFNVLKNILGMVSSFPRSIAGHFSRYLFALLAYAICSFSDNAFPQNSIS